MAASLSADSDVVTYFNHGLDSILGKDFTLAREHFEWCRDALQAQEADVFRAIAWLDGVEGTAGADNVRGMYETLPTWGRLLQLAGKVSKRPLPANTFEAIVQVVPDLAIAKIYRCPEVAALGYGSILIGQGNYDQALAVLDSADRQLPAFAVARMYLYATTRRWEDVRVVGQSILNPYASECDKDGNLLTAVDAELTAVAHLYVGMAHAYLGNFDAAYENLSVATANGASQHINVEACYLYGLMARAAGEESAAVTRFNSGQAFMASRKLADAAADPSIRLKQTTAELISQRTAYWDPATEPDLDDVKAVELEEQQSSLLAQAEAELERQIGMAGVKKQVRDRKDKAIWEAEAIRRGSPTPGQSLHMAFTGPPGTGKTTTARVIAMMYAGIGLLTLPDVIEVGRDDLVGNVIGETENKTNAVINSALGGVLFIDEAYSLAAPQSGGGGSNDFGLVALNTLLARMENDRDKLVVIIAGYEKDINQLLAVNEGFGSRFARRIRFDRYSPEEIGDIAGVIATSRNSILPAESRALVASETRARVMVTNPNDGRLLLDVAGNGRFARNVVEAAEDARAARLRGKNLSALSHDEMFTLTPADVQAGLDAVINPLLGINDTHEER